MYLQTICVTHITFSSCEYISRSHSPLYSQLLYYFLCLSHIQLYLYIHTNIPTHIHTRTRHTHTPLHSSNFPLSTTQSKSRAINVKSTLSILFNLEIQVKFHVVVPRPSRRAAHQTASTIFAYFLVVTERKLHRKPIFLCKSFDLSIGRDSFHQFDCIQCSIGCWVASFVHIFFHIFPHLPH